MSKLKQSPGLYELKQHKLQENKKKHLKAKINELETIT